MAEVFSITVANLVCKLGADRNAESTYTVTNATDRTIRGQFKLRPLGGTDGAWLSIVGDTECDFSPHQTRQVPVKIKVPPQAPPGKYTFRLDAISAAKPDDDYTEGQVVSIEIPGPQGTPPPPPPWPKYALIAAALVVVIGVGGWLLWPKGVAVPDNLIGHSYDEASSAVTAAGLTPARKDETTDKVPPGTVKDVDPKAGTRLKKSDTVTLTVAQGAAPAETKEFPNPTVRGVALDFCYDWGTNCGKPAADAFCAANGYAQATDLQIVPNNPPTLVIHTNQTCNQPNCTRISWVNCTKSGDRGLHNVRIQRYLELRGIIVNPQ